MRVYKIIDRETGLFSSGGSGSNPWTKTGKSWSTIGHIKSHLNMHDKNSKHYPYRNACIIEVEINYDDCYKYPVDDIMDEIQLNKEEQKRIRRERNERWIRESELRKLEELKEKYEK